VTVVRCHVRKFQISDLRFEIDEVTSDRKKTHKASFTVQASVRLLGVIFRFEIQISDLFVVLSKFYGQATKGTRWMPWHFEAMKDVASCEKLR
jgi:hypothetical protein